MPEAIKSLSDFKDMALPLILQDFRNRNSKKISLTALSPLLCSGENTFSPSDYGKKKLIEILKEMPEYFVLSYKRDDKGKVLTPSVVACSLTKKGTIEAEKTLEAQEQKGKEDWRKRDDSFSLPPDLKKTKRKGISCRPKEKSNKVSPLLPKQEEGDIPNTPDNNNGNSRMALFRTYGSQPVSEIFSLFLWTGSKGETKDTWFERISRVAKKERWSLPSYPNSKFILLQRYLLSSFERAYSQNKILFSPDGKNACFNTGLQTEEGKDVFLFFVKYNKAPTAKDDSPKWLLHGIIDSYSTSLRIFGKEPEPPTFITDPSELVFNHEYSFEVNTKHIIEGNSDRLPEVLRSNPSIASLAINGALDGLKSAIQRDYRLPIPFWYKDKIQLLLPFKTEDKSSFAFVVERDDVMRKYRVKTILPVDMAYSNVRLLRTMEEDWLISSFN